LQDPSACFHYTIKPIIDEDINLLLNFSYTDTAIFDISNPAQPVYQNKLSDDCNHATKETFRDYLDGLYLFSNSTGFSLIYFYDINNFGILGIYTLKDADFGTRYDGKEFISGATFSPDGSYIYIYTGLRLLRVDNPRAKLNL